MAVRRGFTVSKLNQFARLGMPDTLYSDNGPQFASRELKEFASAWHFDYQTSSPHYPQSNGKIENAVKTAKKLLAKANASGQDPYLTILDWSNTQYWIATSPKIVWKTVTYSKNFVTDKDHGGD